MSTQAELRKNRKRRLAKATKEGEADGRYGYNPFHEKPTKLDPSNNYGNSPYHYFGPPPDAGWTYGLYKDSKGNMVITMKGGEVYSPVTGEALELEQEINFKELPHAKISQAMISCPHCATAITSTIQGTDLSKVQALYCPACGDSIAEAVSTAFNSPITGEDENPAEGEEDEAAEDEDEAADASISAKKKVHGADDNYAGGVEMPPKPEGEVPKADDVEPEKVEPVDNEATLPDTLASIMLADIDQMTNIQSDDVNMTLFDQEKDNPFWNLDIQGDPVARIELENHPNAEQIRSTFISAEYAHNLTQAITKVGIREVLESVKASVYANKVNKSDLAKKIRDEVKAEFGIEVKSKLTTMRDRFLHCLGIAIAGFNKNLYSDQTHQLKASFWVQMRKAGVADPMPIIEAAFEDGSQPYFEDVVNKGVEYMDMNPEALDEVSKHIGNSDVQNFESAGHGDIPEGDEPSAQAPTLSSRLAKGNFPLANVIAGVSPSANAKQELRANLQLRRR